jgi:hypothetical protein
VGPHGGVEGVALEHEHGAHRSGRTRWRRRCRSPIWAAAAPRS